MSFGNPIYSVLYIDREKKNREQFESSFRQDYHIFTAGSVREGFQVLEERTIQLVISDIRPGGMDGIQLLEKIMYEFPQCTRMIQAREEEMEQVLRAVDRGIVFAYAAQPWKREELKITIDGALEVYYLKVQNRNLEEHLEEVKQTLERKVMQRTRKIELQRNHITDSIQYASLIQKALMPGPGTLKEHLPEHFLLNKPKDIVSGDFYWETRKEERLILTVADCTGHGVPGAFMSILGIKLLHDIVHGFDSPSAAEILDELRTQVIRALGQTGEMDETREGMEMALCVIDPGRKLIRFSGASRPIYLVRDGELMEYRGDRMPIGIYGDEGRSFTDREIPYKENDILYLFTDGYVDQMGGLQRKTFRAARFRDLILEICNKPMEEQRAILREEHEIWRAGREQIDDIMVLGIRLTY